MKTIIFCFLLLAIGADVAAQTSNIRLIEYGWDADLGTGQNTRRNVSQSSDSFDVPISMQGLTNGYHLLFLRARDNTGRWSQTYIKLVNILTGRNPAKIVRLEYTYTQGTTLLGQYAYAIPTPATSVDIRVPGATAPLSNNQDYLLSIWAIDENGTRSEVYTQNFRRQAAMCETTRTGTWNDTGMWNCGHVPLSSDDVFINPNHIVTIPNGSFPTKSLTYRGGQLRFNAGGRLQYSQN